MPNDGAVLPTAHVSAPMPPVQPTRDATEPWQIRSVAMELAIKAAKELPMEDGSDLSKVAEDMFRFLIKDYGPSGTGE